MNRREFANLVGCAVAFNVVGDKLKAYLPPLHQTRTKFGDFDIEADGTLSRFGQTKFAMYNDNGGLASYCVSYKLHNDNTVEAIETKVNLAA